MTLRLPYLVFVRLFADPRMPPFTGLEFSLGAHESRALYRKLGAEQNIGIHIAEGPHKDTQPLNFGAFNWLNRFLKGADRMDLIGSLRGIHEA